MTKLERQYKEWRNKHLEKAIEYINLAENNERQAAICSKSDEKDFEEGYIQGLCEMCVNSIKFWMNVP